MAETIAAPPSRMSNDACASWATNLPLTASTFSSTCDAVRMFRQSEGLPPGDFVDERTWSALVDASFSLGDRMLYLRMPHFHGADVRSLQKILEVLGFVVGRSDGIFGAHTERACATSS